MWVSNEWTEYELLDAACGERLERWGKHILIRPDPQVIWKTPKSHPKWRTPDAVYKRSDTGGGAWEKSSLPSSWELNYKELTFRVKPMNFKHTGIFPEQACNWDMAQKLITARGRPVKVLNLFAYTGGATVACAKAGAEVTHVDAAKGMVAWAKENAALNKVEARWIVDDCLGFVNREIRRGNTYDAVIMDPPSYGRGPNGEIWKLEENLFDFLFTLEKLLSKDALFVFINSYTTGLAPSVLKYLADTVITAKHGGSTDAHELGLHVTLSDGNLPCGATARWIHY